MNANVQQKLKTDRRQVNEGYQHRDRSRNAGFRIAQLDPKVDMLKHLFVPRGAAQENAYFLHRQTELIEHLREKARLRGERQSLGEAIGITDEVLLQDLQQLGYSHDTVCLLPLAPILQLVWANGEVSERETSRVREIALTRGIRPDTPAFRMLESWLSVCPSNVFFLRSLELIRKLLRHLNTDDSKTARQDLLSSYVYITEGSGAILGLGKQIGAAEEKVLAEIAAAMEE